MGSTLVKPRIQEEVIDARVLQGLSHPMASERLTTLGFNEIQNEAARSSWVLIAQQFKSPLVLILSLACVLSGALGEWS